MGDGITRLIQGIIFTTILLCVITVSGNLLHINKRITGVMLMNKGIVLTLSMLLSVNQAYSSDCGSGSGLIARVKGACTKPIMVAAAAGYAAGFYTANASKASTSKPAAA